MKSLGEFTVQGKHEYNERRFRVSPAKIIPASFLFVILLGTLLLMLPISSADGQGKDLVTALFTATTSVCVTGLVVVDTFAAWSIVGKIVILILIQLGGLGIVFNLADQLLHALNSFLVDLRKNIQDTISQKREKCKSKKKRSREKTVNNVFFSFIKGFFVAFFPPSFKRSRQGVFEEYGKSPRSR